jgi:hypothetical protein
MHRSAICAAWAIALAIAATVHAEAPFDFDRTPGKLPKTVAPVAYRIDITPDLEKLTLAGLIKAFGQFDDRETLSEARRGEPS